MQRIEAELAERQRQAVRDAAQARQQLEELRVDSERPPQPPPQRAEGKEEEEAGDAMMAQLTQLVRIVQKYEVSRM